MTGRMPRYAGDLRAVPPVIWAVLALAAGAVVASCFDFFTYSARGPVVRECAAGATGPDALLCHSDSSAAWHGLLAPLGLMLAVVAAGVVLLPYVVPTLRAPVRIEVVALVCAGAAVGFVLLALVVVPDWPMLQDMGVTSYSDRLYDRAVENGHGAGYWVVLGLLIGQVGLLGWRVRGDKSSSRPV